MDVIGMSRFFRFIFSLFLLLFSLPSAIADAGQPTDVKRIISVGDGPGVQVFALEKTHEKWQLALKTAGFAGRNGLTSRKEEGDGKTPALSSARQGLPSSCMFPKGNRHPDVSVSRKTMSKPCSGLSTTARK